MHTLQQFRATSDVQIFTDAKVLPLFFSTNLLDPSRVVKVFQNDPQANIKVFYYQYLKLCFESETADYQQYIQRIQQLINNEAFSVLFFQDDDPNVFNDAQFKNLIVQFFGILSQNTLSIEQALNFYPIMDVVFVHFFRSLLIFIGQAQSLDSYLDRHTIFDVLNNFFKVKIFEHELCIKFEDTDIFVYEEYPERVYMAFINPNYPPTEVTYEDGAYGGNISNFEAPVEVIDPTAQYQYQLEQRQKIDEQAKKEKLLQDALQNDVMQDQKRRAQEERAREESEQKNKAEKEKERLRKMEQQKEQTRAEEQRALRERAEKDLIRRAKEEAQRRAQEASVSVEIGKNTLRAPVRVNQSYIDEEFVDYTQSNAPGLDSIPRDMKKSSLLEDQAQTVVSAPYLQMHATNSSISSSKGQLQSTSHVQYSFNSMLSNPYIQQPVPEQKYLASNGYSGKAGMTPSLDSYMKPYEVSTKIHPWGLNVTREFTNSFVQKAMNEPYRTKVNEARGRARLNRKSLAPYVI